MIYIFTMGTFCYIKRNLLWASIFATEHFIFYFLILLSSQLTISIVYIILPLFPLSLFLSSLFPFFFHCFHCPFRNYFSSHLISYIKCFQYCWKEGLKTFEIKPCKTSVKVITSVLWVQLFKGTESLPLILMIKSLCSTYCCRPLIFKV